MSDSKLKSAPAGAKIGYILDREGRVFSEGSCRAVQEIAANADPGFKAGLGVLFLSGPEYQDPAVLAESISVRPMDTVVAVYDEDLDAMAVCKMGPGPDGIQSVIGVLEQASKDGASSWDALHKAVDWEAHA